MTKVARFEEDFGKGFDDLVNSDLRSPTPEVSIDVDDELKHLLGKTFLCKIGDCSSRKANVREDLKAVLNLETSCIDDRPVKKVSSNHLKLESLNVTLNDDRDDQNIETKLDIVPAESFVEFSIEKLEVQNEVVPDIIELSIKHESVCCERDEILDDATVFPFFPNAASNPDAYGSFASAIRLQQERPKTLLRTSTEECNSAESQKDENLLELSGNKLFEKQNSVTPNSGFQTKNMGTDATQLFTPRNEITISPDHFQHLFSSYYRLPETKDPECQRATPVFSLGAEENIDVTEVKRELSDSTKSTFANIPPLFVRRGAKPLPCLPIPRENECRNYERDCLPKNVIRSANSLPNLGCFSIKTEPKRNILSNNRQLRPNILRDLGIGKQSTRFVERGNIKRLFADSHLKNGRNCKVATCPTLHQCNAFYDSVDGEASLYSETVHKTRSNTRRVSTVPLLHHHNGLHDIAEREESLAIDGFWKPKKKRAGKHRVDDISNVNQKGFVLAGSLHHQEAVHDDALNILFRSSKSITSQQKFPKLFDSSSNLISNRTKPNKKSRQFGEKAKARVSKLVFSSPAEVSETSAPNNVEKFMNSLKRQGSCSTLSDLSDYKVQSGGSRIVSTLPGLPHLADVVIAEELEKQLIRG